MKRLGRLELVAFTTGFALLAYELVAARMLAPSIGSSTYVWTSVIGIIIAALSLGYWYGGRVADARSSASDVAWLVLLSALLVAVTRLTAEPVLEWAVGAADDPRWQAIFATTVLFAPASFVLGMISPYLAKLNVRSLERAGRAVASLGALNSIGGIVGTFVTGFWLFGYVGSNETLVLLVVLLVATSWLLAPRDLWKWRAVVSVAVIIFALVPLSKSDDIIIDSASARYSISTYVDDQGRFIRGLATGPGGLQSGVYLTGTSELPFWYTREMVRLTLNEQPERVLMLGGGAFTIPEYLAKSLPDAQIDVVEIDPALADISREYFRYSDPDNVQLIFDDARSYVEQTAERYDVVLVDVYGDAQIPFSLMSAEYGRSLARLVEPDGVVLVNLIAGLGAGPCRPVFAAFDRVYRQELPYGSYSTEFIQEYTRGNYIVAYSRQQREFQDMKPFEPLSGPLYTDNYAPAERLYFACRQG